ncbi:hypothetical protein LZC95_00970 [Pendulispora brunnea]|uniref:Uncharacterized protein n=1 Tax=Pendulispora brunnea TaxID=2905690 RepID=A0ABZ2K9R9_9BACT
MSTVEGWMNPYAPPSAHLPTPHAAEKSMQGYSGARAVMGPSMDALPCVCVKCGATTGVTVQRRYVPLNGTTNGPATRRRARPVDLAFLGLLVALAAAAPFIWYVRPVLVGGIALMAVGAHVRTRFGLNLPLCASCDARWRNGIVGRNIGLIGILLGAMALSIGAVWPGFALILAAAAGIVAVRIPKRIIACWVMPDNGGILLCGLAPAAAEAIVAASEGKSERSGVGS